MTFKMSSVRLYIIYFAFFFDELGQDGTERALERPDVQRCEVITLQLALRRIMHPIPFHSIVSGYPSVLIKESFVSICLGLDILIKCFRLPVAQGSFLSLSCNI